jgi:signal transduction histidine kinase
MSLPLPHSPALFDQQAQIAALQRGGQVAVESARQSLKMRAQQTIHSASATLFCIAIVTATYYFFVPLWRIAGWVVPLALITLVNARIGRATLAVIQDASVPAIVRMDRHKLMMVAFTNLIMGSGIWWVGLGTDNHGLWFFTTTIQCLYTVGALINGSTHPQSFILGAITNLGPTTAFWLSRGEIGFAVAAVLFSLVVLLGRFARVIHADFVTTMHMRFENLELVRKLEIEKRNAEAAQKTAEQANLAKSRFLAAASHDLRQPLHALMLFAGLVDGASPEQRGTLIAHIRNAADSLNQLFNGLLDLSRLDAGAVQANPVAVRLQPLIETIVREFQPKAALKQLRCEYSAPDVSARSDPFLLERTLRNLIDNAIKYTNAGRVDVVVTTSASHVTIAVEDTGIGIGSAAQARVFDEFFQLHNPARNAEQGTGLGLAIVRRLCELMGHTLALQSREGVGSRFALTLPLIQADAAAPARVAAVQDELRAALRGMRVVVIDDDSLVLAAMQNLLQSWGCVPLAADSIDAALAAVAGLDQPPAALIADFRLAGDSTGFDAVRRLRHVFPELPAAIFTGDTEAHWQQASELPDVPVFQKPVRPEEIADWLAQHLAVAG